MCRRVTNSEIALINGGKVQDMQLADIFAEAYQIDLVELDRIICKLIRIRDERRRKEGPESAQEALSSPSPAVSSASRAESERTCS